MRRHVAPPRRCCWQDGRVTRDALLHPFANPADPESAFIEVVRAEGSELFDRSGKRYLDAMGSLWYCQIGHGNREMIDAITAQLHSLEAFHIFAPFTNGPARDAADAVRRVSPLPDGRGRVDGPTNSPTPLSCLH